MTIKKNELYAKTLEFLKNSPERAWREHELAEILEVEVKPLRKVLRALASDRKVAIQWFVYRQCGYKYHEAK